MVGFVLRDELIKGLRAFFPRLDKTYRFLFRHRIPSVKSNTWFDLGLRNGAIHGNQNLPQYRCVVALGYDTSSGIKTPVDFGSGHYARDAGVLVRLLAVITGGNNRGCLDCAGCACRLSLVRRKR